MSPVDVLDRVDAYLDVVQRDAAEVRGVGPFTLFVSRAPYPLYARPARGATAFTAADLDALATACATAGMPLAVEWVEEQTPALGPVLAAGGLELTRYPLLVLPAERFTPVPPPPGVTVEVASTGAELAVARAVADIAFGDEGTAVGEAGTAERDAAAGRADPDQLRWFVDDATAGRSVTVTAALVSEGVVASGLAKPVAGAAEIMGVATLPAFRRRGLALAVTSALVERAVGAGADLLLLSADSDDVARIYERVGFTRIGHTGQAERPDPRQ